MREIKFRAWDKRENEFVCQYDTGDLSPVTFDSKGNASTYWLNLSCSCDPASACGGCVEVQDDVDEDNLIVMQYTGLKDKNGKEIYEGDICMADSGVAGFIDYHNGRFCWTDGACHWDLVLNGTDRCPTEDTETILYNLEAIGNIYENPELLEE